MSDCSGVGGVVAAKFQRGEVLDDMHGTPEPKPLSQE